MLTPAISVTSAVEGLNIVSPATSEFILPLALVILFLLFSTLWTSLNAQEKRNDEKYLDAYKKYLDASCPIKKDSIQHFVYFARDRELIKGHPFLSHSMFKGAQIMYSWRELEPEKGKYNFSILKQCVECMHAIIFCHLLYFMKNDINVNEFY